MLSALEVVVMSELYLERVSRCLDRVLILTYLLDIYIETLLVLDNIEVVLLLEFYIYVKTNIVKEG